MHRDTPFYHLAKRTKENIVYFRVLVERSFLRSAEDPQPTFASRSFIARPMNCCQQRYLVTSHLHRLEATVSSVYTIANAHGTTSEGTLF